MPVTVNTAAPPVKKTATSAKAATGISRKTQENAQNVNDLGQFASMGLMLLKQPADAGAVKRHFPRIAFEIARLAETNAKVQEFIDSLNSVSPYAGIIAAATPLVMQILVNHDRLAAEAVAELGVVTKKTLISESNT